MKHLIGSLAVMSTDFKSGTFLASLESVECSTKSRLKPPVDIIENIYNPNAFTNVIKIQIEANLHEDFCITTQEMQTFITTEFASLNCRPCKICENNVNMCNDSLENLLDNCTHVNGNVMIGPENEHLVSKLKIVETIYGSLIIRSTNLTHIAFLENLKHILTFNYSVSIIIENNPQFSNLTFPNLKRIYTNSLLTAIMLNNNSDILSPNFKNCDLIHAQFKYLKTKSISLDENTCEAIQRSANNTLEGKLANHPSLGIMGFLNLIIILGAL
ncbi:Receptor L-domain domain-containing protein [Caenorhabditis elegans]|nr:Receptor L-domain domain-containing protein [Caenorhabditis elegans]CUR30065.1 Receptor L-domain domain-containing protein [Caenorhabditis elegans]|eukprot:NP_001303766.1 Insulin/EGF-Receptor L Domain protein [Caenorhabditis elegans]